MGFNLAEAVVTIGMKDTGLNAALSNIKSSVADVGSKLAGLQGYATAAFAAVVAGIGLAVKEAADFGETASKFEAVFKDQTKAATAWGEAYASAVGRAKSDIFTFLASIQSVTAALGFSRKDAAQLSESITQLAVDLASFNNMTDEDALAALQSGILSGEAEPLKKFGVIVNDAALDAELLKMGIKGGSDAASEQQKVLARLNIVMKATTDAHGDAIRTSDSFANQLRGLKGQVTDAAVELGSMFIPMLSSAVSKIRAIIPVIGNWISQNKELVLSMVKWGLSIAAVLAFGPAVIAFGSTVVGVFMAVAKAALTVGLAMLQGFLSPVGLIVAGLALVGTAFAYLIGDGDTFKERTLDGFMKIVTFLDSMLGSWGGFVQGIKTIWNQVPHYLLEGWYQIRDGALTIWEGMKYGFRYMLYSWGGAIADFVVQAWAGFKTLAEMVSNLWNTMIDAIANKMASVVVKRQAANDVEGMLGGKKIGAGEAGYLAGTELTIRKQRELQAEARREIQNENPFMTGPEFDDAAAERFMQKQGQFLQSRRAEWLKWWGGKELDADQIAGVTARVAQDRADMLTDLQRKERENRDREHTDRLVEIDKEARLRAKAIKDWSTGGKDGADKSLVDGLVGIDKQHRADMAAQEAARRAELEADLAKLRAMPKLSDAVKEQYEALKSKLPFAKSMEEFAKLQEELNKIKAKVNPDDFKIKGGEGIKGEDKAGDDDKKKKGKDYTTQSLEQSFQAAQIAATFGAANKMAEQKAIEQERRREAKEAADQRRALLELQRRQVEEQQKTNELMQNPMTATFA